MKEFEKWRKKNDWKWYHYDNSFTMETYMEEAWKAALEWALQQRDKYCEYNTHLWNKLEKELNEDN